MLRKIIRIDESKCDGCGQCVTACAEGALAIIDGKARLVSQTYCDGLGACIGQCPQGALTIEQAQAEAFDAQAVAERTGQAHQPAAATAAYAAAQHAVHVAGGCPGSMIRQLRRPMAPQANQAAAQSRLGNWPVQLALAPVTAPYYQAADLLIAADCVAFAMPDFQEKLLTGRTLAIACPKLDLVEPYVQKLSAIFAGNDIRSVTVAHMEVPCCMKLVQAVKAALERSGRSDIPMSEVTIGIDGAVQRQTQHA